MTDRNSWKSYIFVAEGAVHANWALAGYTDAQGVVHYTREGQYSQVFDAFLAARDYARILGENGHTPESEGSTFTSRDMPAGRFLDADEIDRQIAVERAGIASGKIKAPKFF